MIPNISVKFLAPCFLAFFLTAGITPAQQAAAPGPLLKSGQQIVFLGDSTTQNGWTTTSGFIHLVAEGLATENTPVKVLQVSSQRNRAKELLDLYQTKVATMTPKPDWLVISCGLDEVTMNLPGSDLATFQADMKSLVDEAKAAGINVMILTTSVSYEKGDKRLDPYNAALRALAASGNFPLADVNAAEMASIPTLPAASDGSRILQHGSQLNNHGQMVVASEILKAFGMSPAQLSKIQEAWLDVPKSAPGAMFVRLIAAAPITLGQYEGLEAFAAGEHQSLSGILNGAYSGDVVEALRAGDASSDLTSIQNAAQTFFIRDVSALVGKLPPAAPAKAAPAPVTDGAILVKKGQKIAFLGDSITQFGWQHPDGYVKLVVSALDTAGVPVTPVPAGVSGNTSRDMLARLQKSVLDEKPDWMTLSCGVNDVWHGVTGCDLDTYKKNITSIVDQAQKAGIQIVILTATMIQESDNAFNQKLVAYNDFLHELAKARKFPVADLNQAMQDVVKAGGHPTVDGVHMNPDGNVMMANGVLKAFGLSDAQLAQAKERWLVAPDSALAQGSLVVAGSEPVTLRQSDALEKLAVAKGLSLADYLTSVYMQALVDAAKADPKLSNPQAIQAAAQPVFLQKVAALTQKP